MIVEVLFGLSYAVIALLAMVLTTIEQSAKEIDGRLQHLAGLVACTLWPLTVLAIVAAVSFNTWHGKDASA